MSLMKKSKGWHTVSDSADQIQMCLNCKMAKCIDCIGSRAIVDGLACEVDSENMFVKRSVNATDVKVLNLYLSSTCDRDIAESANMPISTVTDIRKKFKLPPIRSVSFEKRQELVDKWLKKGA